MTDTIIKRDGREVSFDQGKITAAILKAFQASGSAKTESKLANGSNTGMDGNGSQGRDSIESIRFQFSNIRWYDQISQLLIVQIEFGATAYRD